MEIMKQIQMIMAKLGIEEKKLDNADKKVEIQGKMLDNQLKKKDVHAHSLDKAVSVLGLLEKKKEKTAA